MPALSSGSPTAPFPRSRSWKALRSKALPRLRSAVADGSHLLPGSFALSAALGFAIAQLVAGLRVLRDRDSFFPWLMPAALYLFSIGVIGWFRHGELQPLWLDSARGLLLIGLGYAHLRALRGARTPS